MDPISNKLIARTGASGDAPYPSLCPFGANATFHHVGIVVEKIDECCPGVHKVLDQTQKVWVAFVTLHGTTVEFIEPCGPDSPVASTLKKGTKLAHLCYEVLNIDAAIATAMENDFFSIAPPVPAAAFAGRKIAWLYHTIFGLIELLEAI